MILLTGATGHLGYTVAKELYEEGNELRFFVLPAENISRLLHFNGELVYGDIRDREAVSKAVAGCEAVIHMAGVVSISKGRAAHIHDVNVNGTKNILEASLENKVKRLVHVSSVHALTERPHGIPVKEDLDFNPARVSGDYAKSKALASIEVLKACDRGLDAVIVFPSGIIGPFDYPRTNNSVNSLSRLLNTKAGDTVICINGGYDFVDVRDVAHGIVIALRRGKTGHGYILSGEYISVHDMNQAIADYLGILIKQKYFPFAVDLPLAGVNEVLHRLVGKPTIFTSYAVSTLRTNSQFDNTKAKTELNYSPRSVGQSIAETLDWVREMKMI